MKRLTTTLLFIAMITLAKGGPIGSWTSYLAYGDITEIVPVDKMVYVLSSKGLFSYNTNDHSVETYDKMNTLSDCNISHIAYCKAAKRLVIVYENYNIDLLDDKGNVVNISDYYNKSMTMDKTINSVKTSGSYAFISTNFGILKINVAEAEITATYNLGRKVKEATTFGNHIYAVCEEGIIKGNTNDNLLDKSNWMSESDIQVDHLFDFGGKLLAANNGNIYCKDGDEWKLIQQYAFNSCNISGDKLLFVQDHGVMVLNSINDITFIQKEDVTLKAVAYDNKNHCFWSNQDNGKLCSFILDDNNEVALQTTDINPDGPKYNYFGVLKYVNHTLFSCGGGFDSAAELFRKAVTQTYSDDEWTIYEDDLKDIVGNRFEDMTCLDIDPKDPKHVFVGGRTGLYEYLDGKFVKHYNPDNSPLGYALDSESKNYVLTLGIKFDKQGNLWCLNSQAKEKSILELKTDGTWEEHHKKNLMEDTRSLGNMRGMILDSRGLLWFVNNHWDTPSFYCLDPSNSAMNHYTTFVNEDGTRLEPTGVRCVAEDKDGNIWIGTSVGPVMLPANDIDNGSNSVLQQIKVPRNDGTNFADYLLGGADINCIAVDGGNRKWFGTNGNGVYLISADNMTQLQHFLSSNSQLLSDNIEAITINDETGEVFFGTDNGLCSYMSDATATSGTMNKNTVYAYPNPVKPDYTGLITVTGLTMNADVKIVTANGTLVAEGTSNGGTFTWDGCDDSGKRVASGVYMVQTATSDGKKGTVCKIAIVR